ncbi:hypothetical protein BGZ60DRAFT_558475 [Tricladium varicosporioides]|nr:hypothetical protein BGZ60DRAFT_558475 [Hymenoscyphus varicosporioides]
MQFPTVSTVVLALATAVMAQIDLSALPTCAQVCFVENLTNTACSSTDIACLCGDSTYFLDVQVCVLTDCSTDDANTTLAWASTTCAAAGVPLKKRSMRS